MIPISIAVAGSMGAVSRFVLDGHIRARYNLGFPWATLVINSSGSLILGIVSGILLKHHSFTTIEAVIGTGFCGGYTTFSTASFETVRLLEERKYAPALGNAVGGIIVTIIAALLGIAIGRLL